MRSRSIGECALPSASIRSAKSAPVLVHPSKPFLPDIVLTPLSDELSGSATSANFCTPFSLFYSSCFQKSASSMHFPKGSNLGVGRKWGLRTESSELCHLPYLQRTLELCKASAVPIANVVTIINATFCS